MEFLETHMGSNIKAVWRNDIDISAKVTEKSEDDDSKDKSIESEHAEEEKDKVEEKIADKVISDLEVYNEMIIIEYNIDCYYQHSFHYNYSIWKH